VNKLTADTRRRTQIFCSAYLPEHKMHTLLNLAIALAQARRAGMALNLPEGHDGYCGDRSSPQ